MEKIIQITSGRGPLECQWVVAKVLKLFLQEAKQEGIFTEVISREEGDENLTLKSATILLKHHDLDPFLKGWLGSICWVGKSTFRKFHQRSNWFIGVFELKQLQSIHFDMKDLVFQMVRSQGSGGQNVNKVNSAVRATHLPTGLSVFAQDSRSQTENKKLAVERIKQKIFDKNLEHIQQQIQDSWNNHLQVERGNAVKTFHGTDFKRHYVDKSYKKERNQNKQIINFISE